MITIPDIDDYTMPVSFEDQVADLVMEEGGAARVRDERWTSLLHSHHFDPSPALIAALRAEAICVAGIDACEAILTRERDALRAQGSTSPSLESMQVGRRSAFKKRLRRMVTRALTAGRSDAVRHQLASDGTTVERWHGVHAKDAIINLRAQVRDWQQELDGLAPSTEMAVLVFRRQDLMRRGWRTQDLEGLLAETPSAVREIVGHEIHAYHERLRALLAECDDLIAAQIERSCVVHDVSGLIVDLRALLHAAVELDWGVYWGSSGEVPPVLHSALVSADVVLQKHFDELEAVAREDALFYPMASERAFEMRALAKAFHLPRATERAWTSKIPIGPDDGVGVGLGRVILQIRRAAREIGTSETEQAMRALREPGDIARWVGWNQLRLGEVRAALQNGSAEAWVEDAEHLARWARVADREAPDAAIRKKRTFGPALADARARGR